MSDTAGYIFGAPGLPATPQELASRRAMAQALVARALGQAPRNVGEGLNAIGQALIAREMLDENTAADQAAAAKGASVLAGLLPGAGAAVPAGSATAAPTVAAATGSAPTVSTGFANVANALSAVPDSQRSLLADATTKYGLPPGYLAGTARIESDFNPNALNKGSGAAGEFQFVPSTAKEYGLANPYDLGASTDAVARLAADNARVLTAGLGRPPTAGELYLAHQQGAGGALKILQNPNAPVGPNALANGAKPGMTNGQFAQMWLTKFDGPAAAPAAAPIPNATPHAATFQMMDLGGATPDEFSPPQTGVQRVAAALAPPSSVPRLPASPVGISPLTSPQNAITVPTGAPQAPAQAPAAVPAAPPPIASPGPSLQQLVAAASSPYLSAGQRSVVNAMLAQKLKEQANAADPLRQLQIAEARKNLGKSDLPPAVETYQFARSQGYQGSFQDWAAQARNRGGRYYAVPTGSGTMLLDKETGMAAMIGVDANGNPVQIGKPFQPTFDTNGNPVAAVAPQAGSPPGTMPTPAPTNAQPGIHPLMPPSIAAGPQGETARAKAQGAAEGKIQGQRVVNAPKAAANIQALHTQWNVVDDNIDKAISQLGTFTTGTLGSLTSAVPGTPAYNLARTLDTIKANIGFNKLQQMRESSPTGGALGQVSDFENRLLQSVYGSLEQAQSPAQLHEKLLALKGYLQDFRQAQIGAFKSIYPNADPSLFAVPGTGKNSTGAPGFQEGQTATNPQTGARVIYRGGQWVPLQ